MSEESEEDGDGQYFHYLTKWMYALYQMSIITNNNKYNEWAIELAQSIFDKFVDTKKESVSLYGRPRMYWKMSIDLTKPLVNSEGNLDPIDGYVTYKLIQSASGNRECLKKGIYIYVYICAFFCKVRVC